MKSLLLKLLPTNQILLLPLSIFSLALSSSAFANLEDDVYFESVGRHMSVHQTLIPELWEQITWVTGHVSSYCSWRGGSQIEKYQSNHGKITQLSQFPARLAELEPFPEESPTYVIDHSSERAWTQWYKGSSYGPNWYRGWFSQFRAWAKIDIPARETIRFPFLQLDKLRNPTESGYAENHISSLVEFVIPQGETVSKPCDLIDRHDLTFQEIGERGEWENIWVRLNIQSSNFGDKSNFIGDLGTLYLGDFEFDGARGLPSTFIAWMDGQVAPLLDFSWKIVGPRGIFKGPSGIGKNYWPEAQVNAITSEPGKYTITCNVKIKNGQNIDVTKVIYLLPVEVAVRKKGELAAPTTGLLVKKGDSLEIALAPQFFDSEDNFESLITWQYRQLKGDGSYTPWTAFGANATGTKFEHVTTAGGIFQVKALINGASEHEYKRRNDAPHGANSAGTYNEKLRKGELDFVGVVEKDIQIPIRNQAMVLLGSAAYAKSGSLLVGFGVDSTLDFRGSWKCNIFVFQVSNFMSLPVVTKTWRDYRFGVPPYTDRQVPPGANDWYNSTFSIPSWIWVASSALPQPGYVAIHQHTSDPVSGGAHMGVLDYDGTWINAGATRVNKSIHVSDASYQPTNYRKP